MKNLSQLDELLRKHDKSMTSPIYNRKFTVAAIKSLMLEVFNDVDKAFSSKERPGIVWLDRDELRERIEKL